MPVTDKVREHVFRQIAQTKTKGELNRLEFNLSDACRADDKILFALREANPHKK